MDVLPDYKDCILGCVSAQNRILAMKYASAYITLDQTLSTRTTQQWMTMEAAASRLPVVHHGSLPIDDVRKDLIIECPKNIDIIMEFIRFQEDDLYRERMAHLGWRKTSQEHTFAHRVQKLCQSIGIEHDWEEYPKASLITPTFRRELLPRCLETYDQQTYPNKELVLVFNGNSSPSPKELGLKEPRKDVKISNVPSEMFAGACLNQGHIWAEGEYFFRVDDDDYYGPNYILDMILQARCVDAVLFGKPFAPLIFEGENIVHRVKDNAALFIAPQSLMKKIRLSGNSVSGTAKFFLNNHYSDESFGAADTVLMNNISKKMDAVIVFSDQFNMAAFRRKNLTTHTWKYDVSKLKNGRDTLIDLKELFI
jgi:hypothetical protein